MANANPLGALNIELQGQDFTPVLLPPGQYPMQITGAIIHQSKNGRTSLKVKAGTAQEYPSTVAGQTVDPGTELEMYVGLQVDPTLSDKDRVDSTKRMLSRLQNLVCSVFNASPNDCPNLNQDTINQMVGRQVIGVVDIESDAVYGDRNRLQAILTQG